MARAWGSPGGTTARSLRQRRGGDHRRAAELRRSARKNSSADVAWWWGLAPSAPSSRVTRCGPASAAAVLLAVIWFSSGSDVLIGLSAHPLVAGIARDYGGQR